MNHGSSLFVNCCVKCSSRSSGSKFLTQHFFRVGGVCGTWNNIPSDINSGLLLHQQIRPYSGSGTYLHSASNITQSALNIGRLSKSPDNSISKNSKFSSSLGRGVGMTLEMNLTMTKRRYSSSRYSLKDKEDDNSSSSSSSSSLRKAGEDDFSPKLSAEEASKSRALEMKKARESALDAALPNLYEDTFGPDSMRVTGYGNNVFEINGVVVESSIVVLASSFFYWNCRTIEDISVEKLALFPVLYPKPEILLIGCGTVCNPLFNRDIINQMNNEGIVVEFLSSPIAASTFNVLNAEGRNVALCLVTLEPVVEKIDAII